MTHPWSCGAREAERADSRTTPHHTTPLLALILIFIISEGELGLTNDNTPGGDKGEYLASVS